MNLAGHVQHSPPFLGSANEGEVHDVDGAAASMNAGLPKRAHPILSLYPLSRRGHRTFPGIAVGATGASGEPLISSAGCVVEVVGGCEIVPVTGIADPVWVMTVTGVDAVVVGGVAVDPAVVVGAVITGTLTDTVVGPIVGVDDDVGVAAVDVGGNAIVVAVAVMVPAGVLGFTDRVLM
jgi:hypothetical protein